MKNKNESNDLEISLRCPGCCNYLHGKHRANLLKCGHNICTECLYENTKREKSVYTCLICLGEYSEEDIAINFLFDELISKYLNLNQSDKNCREESHVSNYSLYCVQCDTILSNSDTHSKLFGQHNIISLNAFNEDKNEYYKNIAQDFIENYAMGNNNLPSDVNSDGKSQIKSKIEEFLKDQLEFLNARVKEIERSDKNSNLDALKLLGLLSQDEHENLLNFKNLLKSNKKDNISSDSPFDSAENTKKFLEDKIFLLEKEKTEHLNTDPNTNNRTKNKKKLEKLCKNILEVDSINKNKVDHITAQLKEISTNINSLGYENQLENFAKDLGEEMANYLKNFLNFNINSKFNSITLDQQYFTSQDLTQLIHFEIKDGRNLIYIYDSLSERYSKLDFGEVEGLDLNSNNVSICSDGLNRIYLIANDEFYEIKISECSSENTFTNIKLEEIPKGEDSHYPGENIKAHYVPPPVEAKIEYIKKFKTPEISQEKSKKISTTLKLYPSRLFPSILIYYDFKVFLIGRIHNKDISHNTVKYFDLISNIWINLPELPETIEHPRAVIVSNRIYILNYIKSCFFFDLDTDADSKIINNSWQKIKLLYDDSYNLQLRNYSIIVERFTETSRNENKNLKDFEFLIVGGVYYQDSIGVESKSFNTNVFRFSSVSGLIEVLPPRKNIVSPQNGVNLSFKNSCAVMDVLSNYVLLGENEKGEVKLMKWSVNN